MTTVVEPTSPGAPPHLDVGGPQVARLLALEVRGLEFVEETWRDASDWLRVVAPDEVGLRRRLELVVAFCDTQLDRFEQGAATIAEIRLWAAEHHARVVRARAERHQAGLLRRAGETATSLEHALASVSLLGPGDPPELHADHLLGLADSLAVAGTDEQSLARYQESLALAEELGDTDFVIRVINNLAYTYYDLGRVREALPLCDRMVTMSAAGAHLSPYALGTLADVYLGAGLPQRAEDVLATVQQDSLTTEDRADHLLSSARVQRAFGRFEAARVLVARSLEEARDQGMGEHEVRALREQSEISVELGDFEAAYHQLAAFHERCVGQFEAAAESRTRMVQAIFEVTAARRESEAYRELSTRDALTGLRNRRYVDEHFDTLIRDTRALGSPMSVAFLDLDHFKRVNDTWSHHLGDQVLVAVGQLLLGVTAAVPGAFAARMGGEEFLVVLPGLDDDAGAARLERFRATFEAHGWAALAAGLSTTVSIGLASLGRDGEDRLSLLRAADRRLYAAKAAGRNRIAVDG